MIRALAILLESSNFKKKFPRVRWSEGAEHAIFLEPDVYFKGEAFLYPNVTIFGTTDIGDGCTIEPNCYIASSSIGKQCTLAGHIEKSIIGQHSRIHSSCRFVSSLCGEYCKLKGEIENSSLGDRVFTRSGCVMYQSTCGHDSEIGAEVRRSKLGNQVKVVHQNSYLGDTVFGDGTNFAAGSITLNYDGTPTKKKTKIGSGCFIGAGNLLVAPLVIGNNVATAAGITIRENIPDNTFVGPDGKHRPNKLLKVGKHWTREK